jgi:hypothetical protein
MLCQATYLSQNLGRFLVVDLDVGQKYLNLAFYGISESCNEFSLERLIHILWLWIPYAVAYLRKNACLLDACKYCVGPVFVQVDFVNVKLCIHLCEHEVRVIFKKWRKP